MMKSLTTTLLIAGLAGVASGQINQDDLKRIRITPYVSAEKTKIPAESAALLTNKMSQIVLNSGLSSSGIDKRFIITPNVAFINKEIVPSSPPMHSYNLEVTFYIGDAVAGTVFSTATKSVTGVGVSEEKALIDAFKQINAKDKQLDEFVKAGKEKILSYYQGACDVIITQAKSLSNQQRYDEAIFQLISVPDAVSGCYQKCVDAIKNIYTTKINVECKRYLNEANNAWSSNMSYEGAESAATWLGRIEPTADCYAEARQLRDKMSKRLLEIDKRNWDFKWESEIGVTKDLIKAYRDIGVAWGNNQPKNINVLYNVNHWW